VVAARMTVGRHVAPVLFSGPPWFEVKFHAIYSALTRLALRAALPGVSKDFRLAAQNIPPGSDAARAVQRTHGVRAEGSGHRVEGLPEQQQRSETHPRVLCHHLRRPS